MPRTQISCTLEISGTFEDDRKKLINAIRDRLLTSTTWTAVEFKDLRPRDESTKLSFQAAAAGRPDRRHFASIETLVEDALKPFEADNRSISADIANLQFERLPD